MLIYEAHEAVRVDGGLIHEMFANEQRTVCGYNMEATTERLPGVAYRLCPVCFRHALENARPVVIPLRAAGPGADEE